MKKLRGIFKLRFKRVFYLFTHFKAAILDTWANGGVNVFRARAEFHPHRAHAFFHDSLHRPAPAGMKCAYGFAFGIDEQNREAICSKNAQRDAAQIGHKAVAYKRAWP